MMKLSHKYPLYLTGIIAISIVSFPLAKILIEPASHISDDPALFFIGGRELLAGNPPYSTFWDIKPPGIFYVTALLAAVTGSASSGMIIGGAFIAALSVIAASVGTASLAQTLDIRPAGVLVAGVLPLTYEVWATGFQRGLYPYHLAAIAGLVAFLLAARRDSPVGVGSFLALSLIFWQFAVGWLFATAALLWTARESLNRGYVRDLTAGFLVVGVILWLPIIILGAGKQALVQTVLVPLGWTLFGPGDGGLVATGYFYIPVASLFVLGSGGVLRYLIDTKREKIDPTIVGLIVGLGFYGFVAQATGQSAGLDGIPLILFTAVAAAMGFDTVWSVVTHGVSSLGETTLMGILLATLVLNPFVWWVVPVLDPPSGDGGEITTEFLNEETVSECLLRGSDMEKWWVARTPEYRHCSGDVSHLSQPGGTVNLGRHSVLESMS